MLINVIWYLRSVKWLMYDSYNFEQHMDISSNQIEYAN